MLCAASRLVQQYGANTAVYENTNHLFPVAATLADANLDGLCLTRRREATLKGFARTAAGRTLNFNPGQDLIKFIEACCKLPGLAALAPLRASAPVADGRLTAERGAG